VFSPVTRFSLQLLLYLKMAV